MTIDVEIKNVGSSWDMSLRVYKEGEMEAAQDALRKQWELHDLPEDKEKLENAFYGKILHSGQSTTLTTWAGDKKIIVEEVAIGLKG